MNEGCSKKGAQSCKFSEYTRERKKMKSKQFWDSNLVYKYVCDEIFMRRNLRRLPSLVTLFG